MSPLQTLSLSIWREWRARWPVFALAAACAVLPAVLPEREAGGWALFSLYLVLPALACFAAAGGSAASDAFWRGLGGPAWARSAGPTLLHLVFFALPIAALLRVDPPGEGGVASYAGLLLTLYGATRAARGVTAGVPVLLGPLLGLAGLAGWSLLTAWLDVHQKVTTVGPRAGLLGAAALLAALWLDARFGAWGAGMRRGAVPAALGLAFSVPALAAVSELGFGWIGDAGSAVVDFDETRVLRWNWRGEGRLARDWYALEEGGVSRELPAADGAAIGPDGAWVSSDGRWVGNQLEGGTVTLFTAQGTRSCPTTPHAGCFSWQFRPDGGAVAAQCGSNTYVVDLQAGCERVEGGAAGWLGDTRIDVRGGVVRVGDTEVGHVDGRVRLRVAEGVAILDQLDRFPEGTFRVAPAALEPLGTDKARHAYVVDGAVCVSTDAGSDCRRVDGTTMHVEAGLLSLTHGYALHTGVVTDLRDGRQWQVPAGTLPRRIRVVGDEVRYIATRDPDLGERPGWLEANRPSTDIRTATPLAAHTP